MIDVLPGLLEVPTESKRKKKANQLNERENYVINLNQVYF